MPRPSAPVLGLAVVALAALTACSGGGPDTAVPAVPVAPAPSATATTSPSSAPAATPSASPSVTAPIAAPPTAAPTASRPALDVKAVQTALTKQKYYVGAIDGEPGGATRSAVTAFQKVNGLSADGDIGPQTLAALGAPTAPVLQTGPADRVEVDLTRQVVYLVKGGRLERVLAASSGNGERYSQKSGGTATALTPTGWFTIERRIVGLRKADLGTLYDPQYFYRGWAIHGSNSVPAGPASHGCVRVSRADATYLLDAISVGIPVHLYGGEHVFSAGSGAPGTDNPTGDEPATPTASPTASSTPSPTPSPRATPAPRPTETPTATATPRATASPSPRPTR